jgi:Cu+-exporting ATPase
LSSTSRFLVNGMDCGDCATQLERQLLKNNNVVRARVTFLTRVAEVDHVSGQFTLFDCNRVCSELGFSCIEAPSAASRFLNLEISPASTALLSSVEEAVAVNNRETRTVSAKDALDGLVANRLIIAFSCHGRIGRQERFILEFNRAQVGPRQVFSAVTAALKGSFDVAVCPAGSFGEGAATVDLAARWRSLFLFGALLSCPVAAFSFFVPNSDRAMARTVGSSALRAVTVVDCVMATLVLAVVGRYLGYTAYLSLRNARRANMDCLVMLSTSVAYLYSVVVMAIAASTAAAGPGAAAQQEGTMFFEVPPILLTLVVLGRWLEVRAKERTSSLLQQTLSLQASEALLLPPLPAAGSSCSRAAAEAAQSRAALLAAASGTAPVASERAIPVELVEPGDLLRVPPGHRVPVDGTVVLGSSAVDEGTITGEGGLVPKAEGAQVFGGSINGPSGAIIIRADSTSADSAIHTIMALVTEAQAAKAPVQRTADAVAARFMPCILAMSLLTLIVWLAVAGSVDRAGRSTLAFALQFALSVLVVSCPCAVALAVPTAVCVGTAVAARHGAIVKGGGEILELLGLGRAGGRLVVVFDKTGTLTSGAPEVTAHEIADRRLTENAFLSLVASAELSSEHPLGRAMVSYARSKGATRIIEADDFLAVTGRGVSSSVLGKSVAVGSIEWLAAEEGAVISEAQMAKINDLSAGGLIVVGVAVDGKFSGHLTLRDNLRPEAAEVIRGLHARGLEVRMLTGDREGTALYTAKKLGLSATCVDAGVLPGGKVDRVQRLQGEGKVVCFVGDGVNDSPALAAADIGISVATASSLATSSADITLLHASLHGVTLCVDLSRAVMQRIKLNFCWAALYNLTAIPIAAGVFYPVWKKSLPPALAGVSELLSSLPVVLFSLLLTRFEPEKS